MPKYIKAPQNTYFQPKKSKKWPVIRSGLRKKINFVVAWVWGGVIIQNKY